MKKKIINGILLVAMLFATSSAFVSCKDNDADIETNLLGKIAELQKKIDAISTIKGDKGDPGAPGAPGAPGDPGAPGKSPYIGDNGNWFAYDDAGNAYDTGVKAKGEDGTPGSEFDATEILEKLDKLQEELDELKGKTWATPEEVDALEEKIDNLDTELRGLIAGLEDKIAAIYKTMVTSLNIDAIKNPTFGFVSLPVDVQSNMLIATYGTAIADVEFPAESGNYIADKDAILIDGEGNAGTIYVTINPNSVDFSGKTLTLESTAGRQAPVTLSPLANSEEELKFGGTRASGTAFYEAKATISASDIADAKIELTRQDLNELKDDVKNVIQQRRLNKRGLVDLASDLYTLYAKNKLVAYRLKATWGENGEATFSETKIAAFAVIPLSYSFDINSESVMGYVNKFENAVLKGVKTNDVTKVIETSDGEDVEVTINPTESLVSQIQKYLDIFNQYVEWGVDHVNDALQPTLLVREGNKITRARYTYSGEIGLLPTSWTGEIFAPAYKKSIVVTSNGQEVLNTGVIDGTVKEVRLTVEPGKTYDIEYQAVDYTGVVRVKNYTIYGK